MVRFNDTSRDVSIPALLVTDGPAKGWMRQPVPNDDRHPCMYNLTAEERAEGKHCGGGCSRCRAPWYVDDDACVTPCSSRFPGLPQDVSADPSVFPNPLPNIDFHEYAIEDMLIVPNELPAGEYVLGWRWDAEMTSQVWSSCADITIE